MKHLNFLVNYLQENISNSKFIILIELLNKDEKLLFDAILKNNLTTDIEASKIAFGIRSSSSKYKKTKYNLSEKLHELLFFVEPKIKGAKDEFKNFIQANKSALIGNIMHSTGNIQKLIPYLEDKIKISQKVFSYSSTSVLSNFLMNHYGYINYDKQKFEMYLTLYSSSIECYQKEAVSSVYNAKAESFFSKNRFVDKELFIPQVNQYIAELKPEINVIKSLIYHRNYYNMEMMIHHINKDYSKVIDTCELLLDFIDKWPMKSFVLRKSMIRHKIEHLMLLKNFAYASTSLETLIEEETEGTVGWFSSHRYFILCKVNQRELQTAYVVAQSVINNKHYKSYKTDLKYLIGFLYLYLNIIGKMGFISLDASEIYNVKKFLKEFPDTTKDKAAMNIPIIIAQLFEAIISENQGEVFDRIEALKKYSSRYITKNNNTRSNCFINMLIEVVKQGFHPMAIERHTKRYLSKMNSIPQEISSEAAEVEFIPYEYQWELLMIFLTNRKKNIRFK